MFDTPLVGSFTYNTKCLEATVVGIWCYMNKTHLNIVNWKGHWPLHLFLAIFRKCGLWWEKAANHTSFQTRTEKYKEQQSQSCVMIKDCLDLYLWYLSWVETDHRCWWQRRSKALIPGCVWIIHLKAANLYFRQMQWFTELKKGALLTV